MDKIKKLPQVLLGFDFGMQCIGIAIGQRISAHARPLVVLKAKQGQLDWKALDKLCEEWSVEGFVVGIPEADDRIPKHFIQAIKRFANRLIDRYHIPLFFVDEHYTTVAAKTAQHKQVKKKGAMASRLDALAAAIILQSWFDQNRDE